MGLYLLKPSFAAGEISPALYGRTDIAKYDSGAARLSNFIVLRYGGVANRAGTKYIAQTANNKKAVLLPFRYNTQQNYIIEITAGKIRFFTNDSPVLSDGKVYEIDNDYLESELDTIKYTQSADVMFLVQPNHPPMTLTRYAAANWKFERMDITGGPFDASLYTGANDTVYKKETKKWDSSGTYTLTLPDNAIELNVELAGAGGGGGGAWASSYYGRAQSGGNGGSGEVVSRTVDIKASKSITVTVGAGGTGGKNYHSDGYYGGAGSGANGGSSSISVGQTAAVTARGGGGGTGGGYSDDNGYRKGLNGTSYGSGGAGGKGGVGRSNESSSGSLISSSTAGSDGWAQITYTVALDDNISVSADDTTGEVTLTASAALFSESDVDTLIALSYYVSSNYKKGNPKTDDLQVEVLPGASVYIESFGFWDGEFVVEKYDNASQNWVKIRSQTGNRSQNYNITEENNEDDIVKYRLTSTVFNTDTWSGENEKQRGYVTIQAFGNDYTGHVLITEYISPTQVKGVVKKRLATTEATKDIAFAAWSKTKGFPTCAGFFEDRLVFAANKAEPQTFWTSKTGDYYNFGMSIPSVDNDAVTATLNGGQMNGIKALVAFGELIALTAGGEYKITGSGKPISGSNVMSQAQEYRGISNVLPVTVGSRIVYLQEQGDIIRDLAYSYDVDKYTGDDLNLLASHLFDGHKIISMTYQQTPNSIIWCVRDDGVLLGLTYLKEQDVYAWHQHSTVDGKFINVCSISGLQEDELWCVVEREGRYFIELMAQRDASSAVEDQYFVDCGISYSGEPVKEVGGLEHLEGRNVAVLADGNVITQITVVNGKIQLSRAYSKIHVGLPIEAEVQTLPIEFNGQDGSYLSRKKRIAQLTIMFKDSCGGLYGCNENKLDEIKWRSTEKYGTPIELYTGKKRIIVPQATWSETIKACIRQTVPLPLTILSIVPEVEAGG